jgi:uncharacterized protein
VSANDAAAFKASQPAHTGGSRNPQFIGEVPETPAIIPLQQPQKSTISSIKSRVGHVVNVTNASSPGPFISPVSRRFGRIWRMSTNSYLEPPPTRRSAVISACEALLGAIAVIGHNVYHVVPNEVPILVVLAIASMRWRARAWNWTALGFKWPPTWGRVLLIAACAAALRILLGNFVVEPLTAHFWPPIKAPSGIGEIRGHLSVFLTYLPVIWIFAGLGEEIAYRGFLLNKLSDALGRTRAADVLAVIGSAVLFGFGHYYKGPAGVLDSGIAGLILGAVYLVSGRNLWACVLTHGFIDTFALLAAYLGFDN